MARSLKTLAAAALLLACGLASAQLPKGNGGAEFEGMSKADTNPSQILGNYLDNAQSLLNADSQLLAAVSLNQPAARAAAEAQGLGADASRSQIEHGLQTQTESGQAVAQQLGARVALNDAARLQFINGVDQLSRGLIVSADMSHQLSGIRKTLRDSDRASIAVVYLSKALPGAVRELGQTLQAAVDYAKANNITLPPTANEALSRL